MDGLPRIETLDRPCCVALLAGSSVGRLAFTVPPPGRPVLGGSPPTAQEQQPPGVVPLSYVMDGAEGEESLVFRTTHGSRLGRAVLGAPVSFEVDDLRASAHEGWSVVVGGRARQVVDPAELERLARRLVPWAPGFKELFLRLPLEHVTGRRLLSHDRVIELPETPSPRWRTPEGWAPPTRTAAEYSTDFDGR